ncbi:hypothetical protein [Streptomyces sp. NPDC046685]|uniref:hypothetical protein n=1 Tax=Streptomyces sp. NPDC046685 TaxID=3157202 RepID=UPI0033D454EA
MTSTPVSRSVAAGYFAPAWLPPGGYGNALYASAWAPVADLPADITGAVLDLLAAAHIPAYAAKAPRSVRPVLPAGRVPGSTWRLWVASSSYARAEHVLMTCLPGLLPPQEPSFFPVPVRRSRRRRH